MKKSNIILITILSLLIPFGSTIADDQPAYRIPKIAGAIKVDARLDEPQWQNALKLELNYETRPGDNAKPGVKTEFFIFYDSDRLHVAFKCYDPDPSAIRAHLADRDVPMLDDTVWIQIDTFNDERRCYDFASNPLGVQFDSLEDFSGLTATEDFTWDAIWDSAGQIYDWGYLVEWSIPFSSFRFQKKDGEQTWGINAARFVPRDADTRIDLSPTIRGNNCYLCQIAKITGFEGIEPGRNVELNPTLTTGRTDIRDNFPSGEMLEDNSESSLGITGNWGITPNMTLTGTINPDFSQIEADAAQLDINKNFTLFFPEKRPFFMEGSDFFLTRVNAVHTRVIADPDWGMRLTGKDGRNALGAFIVRDAKTQLIVPGPLGSQSLSAPMENSSSVFRYRRDVGQNSTIGVLATDREGNEYYNRLLGVDGNIRLNGDSIVSFQMMGSKTNYGSLLSSSFGLEEGEISDLSYDVNYIYASRNWQLAFNTSKFGEDFRADMGYVPQVGLWKYRVESSRYWWGDSNSFVRMFRAGFTAEEEYRTGSSNDLLQREFTAFSILRMPRQSSFITILGKRRYNFLTLSSVQNFADIRFASTPVAWLILQSRFETGDWIDYSHIRDAYRNSFNINAEIKAGRSLNILAALTLSSLTVDDERLFLANLTEIKAVYQFTEKMFFRSILQYTDIRRNQEKYQFPVDTHSKDLFSQQLFSYKINPRTVLFLGYGDTYLANQEYGLTQSERSFFAKLGYAWVL